MPKIKLLNCISLDKFLRRPQNLKKNLPNSNVQKVGDFFQTCALLGTRIPITYTNFYNSPTAKINNIFGKQNFRKFVKQLWVTNWHRDGNG